MRHIYILLALCFCLVGSASAADLSGSISGANFALMHQSGQIVYNDTIDGYNSSIAMDILEPVT